MAMDWREYQEEAAWFFRQIGLAATTDERIQGVRTTHDVDVVVRFLHVGYPALWLIECKHWSKPVSKLHVLALREIVADVGADRGILLSESGAQRGAQEAAALTNVLVTSLAELKDKAAADVHAARLLALYDRTAACRMRYWAISKSDRIAHGLRTEGPAAGYSGALVIEAAEELLAGALRGAFPFTAQGLAAYSLHGVREFGSPADVVSTLEPTIADLEGRLDVAMRTR